MSDKVVILSSLYLAPLGYYASIFNSKKCYIEINDNYQKQSYRNRCEIAGANGMLSLSIPIEKPKNEKCKMKDVRISDHGNWRHLHWNAIISAYNSTPFFQYYEDDFRTIYEKQHSFLHEFNEDFRTLIFRLLNIDKPVEYTTVFENSYGKGFSDLREAFHPKRKSSDQVIPPYYQVFEEKNGFIPNMSILDILFNLGNETRLYFKNLRDCCIFVNNN